MKLVKDNDNSVSVLDMKDGDIAIITEWVHGSHIGDIVQRYKYDLVCLGKGSEYSWPNLFNSREDGLSKVEILPKGTRLEI